MENLRVTKEWLLGPVPVELADKLALIDTHGLELFPKGKRINVRTRDAARGSKTFEMDVDHLLRGVHTAKRRVDLINAVRPFLLFAAIHEWYEHFKVSGQRVFNAHGSHLTDHLKLADELAEWFGEETTRIAATSEWVPVVFQHSIAKQMAA